MYDILLKNGSVVDPSQGINGPMDVAVTADRIAALARNIDSSQAKRVVDVTGKIVAPGLIDDHVHCYHTMLDMCASPDGAGVNRGVTTVVDAGSVGPGTLGAFRSMAEPAKTNVYCLLNAAIAGLVYQGDPGVKAAYTQWCEITNWNDINAEYTRGKVEANRDLVLGIKIRAFGPLVASDGIKPIELAKKIAVDSKVPLVVHIGAMQGHVSEEIAPQILNLLEKGDILCHLYTAKPGRVIEPGKPISSELRNARERGVILDVSHGAYNFGWETARHGIAEGVIPDIISSDFATLHIYGPVYGLCETMSKLMVLGLTLEQVVKMTTASPAQALNIADRHGSLKVGRVADISVLELVEARHTFGDSYGDTLEGNLRLLPVFVIKSGKGVA